MAEPEATATTMPGYISDKDKLTARMRRIEGQVRGIARMVDDEVYCIDILTQIAAVTRAIENVGLKLVDDHLSHCVVDAAASSEEEGRLKVQEASEAIARLVRS